MSRKAEASAMMGMAERAEGAAGRKKKAGPVVYCGPTVRGVAKQVHGVQRRHPGGAGGFF